MAKNTARCFYCDQPITYIKRKGKKSIPVQAKAEYYIPQSGGSVAFVAPDGTIQVGQPALDGRKGHRLHNCGRR